MQDLNETLFAAINASANPPAGLVAMAGFFAKWVIFGFALAMVWGWVRGREQARRQLFVAGGTVVLALLANRGISALWYHPRPFEAGLGHTLLEHGVDSSFPSDHASVVFAVAFGLIVARAPALWCVLATGLALGVAWSRVYLGVHWPLDMAGSFIVAGVAAGIMAALMRMAWMQGILRRVLGLYDGLLDLLHIPPALSPRSR